MKNRETAWRETNIFSVSIAKSPPIHRVNVAEPRASYSLLHMREDDHHNVPINTKEVEAQWEIHFSVRTQNIAWIMVGWNYATDKW